MYAVKAEEGTYPIVIETEKDGSAQELIDIPLMRFMSSKLFYPIRFVHLT
jgi:hypothetical protein